MSNVTSEPVVKIRMRQKRAVEQPIKIDAADPLGILGTPIVTESKAPVMPVAIAKAPEPSNKLELDKTDVTTALSERYAKLFQDGYLVNIHVSVWGMCANLSEQDLKIEKVSKFIKLGKKMLIDPEQLNIFKNMESKSRRYLYKNSYDFPISDAHFVPKKRLSDVLTQLAEFKFEFQTIVDAFIENYETFKEAVLLNEDYKDIANLLSPLYPTIAELKEKFGFSVSVFELAMPRAMEETNIQALIDRDEAKEEVKNVLAEQLRAQHQTSLHQLERFAEEAAISLRSQLVTMCTSITDKIRNKELISKANINTIKGEIDNFRALNFLDDAVVATQIDRLETLVNGNHNFKSDAETIEELNTALNNVLSKASLVSDISSIRGKYFRKMNV